MKRYQFRLIILLLPMLSCFLSCASEINGSLRQGGQGEMRISVSLRPRMAALIQGLAAVSGSSLADRPALDGPAIARSLSAAPGIASVSFRNTASAAIEGPLRISQVNDFLAPTRGSGFIKFEQDSSKGRWLVTLNRASGPGILALISPEITDYLSALMAPIATGEALSKTEYLSLVNAVYGKAIADEISQSSIQASIECPGAVRTVRGGTFQGRRADFVIPLLDLLVLDTPLYYEVAWN